MGKTRPLFQFPIRPPGPIKVLGSYDNFFREHLLEAIRDDRERRGGGLPTYYADMLRIVTDYAGTVVDAEQLSLRDLFNFLTGMRSHVPRVQIIDAYLQIVNPEARQRCFPDGFIEGVASAMAAYLASPLTAGYDRELKVKRFLGAYQEREEPKILTRAPQPRADREGHAEYGPRYLYVGRSPSSSYVMLYEFNAPMAGRDEPDQLHLRPGLAFPQPDTFMCVMRDYLFRRRYAGFFRLIENDVRSERGWLLSAVASKERGDSTYRHDTSDFISPTWFDKISDAKTITYIENVAKRFVGVS